MEIKKNKVFISHSNKGVEIVKAFVELLEDIGMPEDSIVCTSVPGYGIPGGKKIYEWLREQLLKYDIWMVFMLSYNYYASVASLNEMGAAWLAKTETTMILLPGFQISDIKGCIDSTEMGILLDGDLFELKHRLGELKENLGSEFSLPTVSETKWERYRDGFLEKIQLFANKTNKQKEVLNDYYIRDRTKVLLDVSQEILIYIYGYEQLMAGKNIDKKRFNEAKKRIFNDILCYGSEDSVKILMYFKKLLASGIDDNRSISTVQIIAPLVLMFMQVRYDATNIKLSPKEWYVEYTSQKMLDTGFYEKSFSEINRIVDLIDLSDFLRVDLR